MPEEGVATVKQGAKEKKKRPVHAIVLALCAMYFVDAAWSGVDWVQPMAMGFLGGEKLGWFWLLNVIFASFMDLAYLSRRSSRRLQSAISAMYLVVIGVLGVASQGTSIGYRVLIALFVIGLVAILGVGLRQDIKTGGGNDGKQD